MNPWEDQPLDRVPGSLSVDPGALPTAHELQLVGVLVALVGGAALAASLLLPLVVLPLLRRWGVVDIPTERSSHTRPTIRGMGLAVGAAVVAVQALALALGAIRIDRSVALVVLVGTAAAAALGWVEDLRGLRIRSRMLGQLGIGALCSLALTLTLGTSVWWLPVCALAVVVYINVANFMDGVNGISGLHGFVVGLLYAWAGASNDLRWMVVAGAAVAFGFLGFLPWNLLRGRAFLGDVGSYLLGGSLVLIAAGGFLSGVYVEYLLPPLAVYLADTSWTLLRRIQRGEDWTAPHRQHVYQRLTDLGFSHLGSALTVAGTTVLVSVISLIGLRLTGAAVVGAGVLVVLILVAYLALPAILRALRPGRSAA